MRWLVVAHLLNIHRGLDYLVKTHEIVSSGNEIAIPFNTLRLRGFQTKSPELAKIAIYREILVICLARQFIWFGKRDFCPPAMSTYYTCTSELCENPALNTWCRQSNGLWYRCTVVVYVNFEEFTSIKFNWQIIYVLFPNRVIFMFMT